MSKTKDNKEDVTCTCGNTGAARQVWLYSGGKKANTPHTFCYCDECYLKLYLQGYFEEEGA